jgi:hypothetical protein
MWRRRVWMFEAASWKVPDWGDGMFDSSPQCC